MSIALERCLCPIFPLIWLGDQTPEGNMWLFVRLMFGARQGAYFVRSFFWNVNDRGVETEPKSVKLRPVKPKR